MLGSLEEFHMVLDELAGDKSMEKIRIEYQKLIHALKMSRENEKRLMSKCRELNAEVVSTSTKVSAALKLSQEDEATVTSLKRELDKAWKMVDSSYDKEKRDNETIRALKEEVTNLMKMAEEQSGYSMDEEQNDLLVMQEVLTKERDDLLMTVEGLRKKLIQATAAQQEVEAQRDSASQTISQLQQELQVQENEISREMRLKEKLDKEVKQLLVDQEAKMGDIKALTLQGQRAKEEQQRLEQQLKELKISNERTTKELEQLHVKNNKLLQDSEQLSSVKEQLSLENHQKANELKMREEEVTLMRQEISKQTKMRETIQKKYHQMEDQKADVDVQRETLKAQIAGLEKDLESSRKQVETDKKAIDELVRERDILNKNMIKAAVSTEKQLSIVKLLQQEKKTLKHEISGYCQEAHKQRMIIHQLERERDRYINETSNLMQKVQQKMDDIEEKETEVFDWRKKVTEAECKLKQAENLMESVVCERNLYSKNLIESQEEIAEMKRKMKIMNNQVTRLRDEITGKELALAKDQQEHKRLEKDNEALKGELQLMKLQLEETKQRVDSQKAEQQKLEKFIADADAKKVQRKKQLEQVIREQENLGKQLIHRNDERTLLYEKIRIQQSILRKGDFRYTQQMEDVRLLKLEIMSLRRKKNILDKAVPNTEDLRRELFHLQRELLRERTRNSVLEEQLKPINIHRWRRLEGSDPGKYGLIQKVQSLQKRLIAKTQELEEHELLLQEKEKLYVELKRIMARQPGPEAAEQLQHCQWTIRERTKELKVLIAELRMLDSKMNEYKSENQRLADELANIKKKYLSQKKLHGEQRTKTKVEQIEPLPQLSGKPHFTGGGFRTDHPNFDLSDKKCLQRLNKGANGPMPLGAPEDTVVLGMLTTDAQTEMKRVVGDNATLPCHHQFWLGDDPTLDIEWLFLRPTNRQRVVITFFAGRVFDPNEAVRSRVAFAGEYLKGDATLLISDLSLTDSGEYSCKVKTGAQYHWSTINLIVLVKPSKPRCWMEGKLLEGADVKMSCKSADGSDPIRYKWERVLDKGKYIGKLPSLALIDLKNPEIVTLKNLTKDNTGIYKCTASNDVGDESCTVEVKMHYVRGMGVVAGAVVGVSFGVLLIILIIWLVFRKKEMKKYEEEETPNEIREDAEAPKAKLVKPNSLSSHSGSSRSGTSSTQSMVHNMGLRGQRACVPAVAALKENCPTSSFPQAPPAYTQSAPKTPEPRSTLTSTSTSNCKPSSPSKLSPGNLSRMGATPVMIPAQTKAFQTV